MSIRPYPHLLGRRTFRQKRTRERLFSLEIARGRALRKRRPLNGPVFLIGSADDSDLVLKDSQIPEGYAYLTVRNDDLNIRWLGEGPELQVNDWPVQNSPLSVGDRIAAGPFEFRVVCDDAPRDDFRSEVWQNLRVVSTDEEVDSAGWDSIQALLHSVKTQILGHNCRKACA